jgi:gliding motility-associated-like protein
MNPYIRLFFFICAFLIGSTTLVWGQCNTLRPQINISFNTDQDCAPVTVTQFTITYFFNASQIPADIEIRYEWNDPANTVTTIDLGSGLIVGNLGTGPNSSYTANSTFTYFDNNGQCSIRPTASLLINGVLCPSSVETQLAFFWGTDEQANANVAMAPANWDVCFDNPVVNAVFTDASEFNCNIVVEPDNPNRFARHTQFVYGTNHNPAATIRNLTLNDGAVVGLTNGAGALVSSSTRGTGGLLVTGVYFGPVDAIPFPADGPVSSTFPMSAPANVANLIGNRFEITLFNWNICNPWNGDAVNPNYEDAVMTTGYIVIVAAPEPEFITEDSGGNPTKNFCIGEQIFFNNETPNQGAYNYTYEFYDDAAGTILLTTSNQSNPTFSYPTGGTKLIRLIASSPTAQGTCEEEFTDIVNITPSVQAVIGLTDFSNVPISGIFCQEAVAPFTNFEVRFADLSTGTITATTEWQWQFFNESNVMIAQFPAVGFSSTALGPFDRLFTTPGVYRAVLTIRDNVTGCASTDEVQISVLNKPVPAFTFNTVCAGTPTSFIESSTLTAINGQQIVSWEWDMDYDGVTFTPDVSLNNQQTFDYIFPAAGSYDVALQVTTDGGGCSAMIVHTVTVDAVPTALFAADVTSGCSVLTVTLTNNSIVGQPAVIDEYVWEVDAGSGFVVDSIQRPTDPGFGNIYVRQFENFGAVNRTYDVRLRVVTQNGCELTSPPQTITVFPGPRSGFIAANYSPFNDNCSPQTVNFVVDNQTQSLNPSDYRWIITDVSGTLTDQSTGTVPNFSFQFINNTQAVRDYQVTLRTTLPTLCARDSVRVIRISPVPISNFTVDTLVFDCQVMQMRFDAQQKGLVEYEWTIDVNGSTLFSQISPDDFLEFDFNRSAIQQDVEVTLKTTNGFNCESTVTTHLFTVPPDDNISISFTATPLIQSLPSSTVTITNNTTPGPWTQEWDFGDGTMFTGANPAPHDYGTYGEFTITLTVTNNICILTQSITVRIDPISPILDFLYDPPNGCAPLTVTFTNLSQFADPGSYFWQFGTNEGVSHAVNPVYTYTRPGLYSVSLSATNILGDTVTIVKSQIIEVFPSPTAQFVANPDTVYVPGGKVFLNNQSLGATTYDWDFGNGEGSSVFEPAAVEYSLEGINDDENVFVITLAVSNSFGCKDTAQVEVRAIKGQQILTPNAFIPSKSGPGSTNPSDTFLPMVRGVKEFHMLVFNRWGQLMFESKNETRGWDGYFNGQLCQQDVYVYKIKAKYDNNIEVTRVGDIHLIQ